MLIKSNKKIKENKKGNLSLVYFYYSILFFKRGVNFIKNIYRYKMVKPETADSIAEVILRFNN